MSLNFFSSAFHGSHAAPYFLTNLVSSSRCSFCKDKGGCVRRLFLPYRKVLEAAGKERGENTHKVQGLLATIHVGKNFFELMAFQALRMLECAHHILLE